VDNRFFIKTEENLQVKHLEECSQKRGHEARASSASP